MIPRSPKPLKSISAKKLKKLGGKMPFSSITKRTKPKRGKAAVVRRRRTKREFARIYGSKDRVLFVKGLNCILGCSPDSENGPIENAHIETGGMGRKADYTKIVPMCAAAHRQFHSWGRKRFEECYEVNLEREARETEEMWQASK